MKITAPNAERMRNQFANEIAGETQDVDPLSMFETLLKNKDSRIINFLNQVWFGIPDSIVNVRLLPSFYLLCDLCSEGNHCLNMGDEE